MWDQIGVVDRGRVQTTFLKEKELEEKCYNMTIMQQHAFENKVYETLSFLDQIRHSRDTLLVYSPFKEKGA